VADETFVGPLSGISPFFGDAIAKEVAFQLRVWARTDRFWWMSLYCHVTALFCEIRADRRADETTACVWQSEPRRSSRPCPTSYGSLLTCLGAMPAWGSKLSGCAIFTEHAD
jgi:hypothetical protein